MIEVRPAGQRGRTNWGWLESRHTFSFGDYYDPARAGFRNLRVINDDRLLRPHRHAWVQVARGSASLNGSGLREGDGAAVTGEEGLRFLGDDPAEVLLFDLA
jgi:redox-sensitive bicupin YhaK (pirin superfamily)